MELRFWRILSRRGAQDCQLQLVWTAVFALLLTPVASELSLADGTLANHRYLATHSFTLLAASLVVIAVLWAWWSRQRDTSTGGVGGHHTPERLQVFSTWALQQIEESRTDAHRQILDDVIVTFATYAERWKKGNCSEVQQTAISRLRVLVHLLEHPAVNKAMRAVNWAWLRDWDQRHLDPKDARLRCRVVLPTICTAAELQRLDLEKSWCPRRGSGQQGDPAGLAYLGNWCADFLSRPDVQAFLGMAPITKGANPASGLFRPSYSLLSAGALYSESSSDEEEFTPVRRYNSTAPSRDVVLPQSQGTAEELFTKRRFEGQEHCWDDADATEKMVRGVHYLSDQMKVHSKPSMLELVEVDLLQTRTEIVHYSNSVHGRVASLRQKGDSRFFFVMNFRLVPIQLAIVWAVPRNADWLESAEGRLFNRFVHEMSDEERSKRVKILPKVISGPWLVKKGVPDRPGILGKKLTLDFFQAQDSLEISINCLSSNAGRRLVQLLSGVGRHFCLEVSLILEGQSPDELPERILGGFGVYAGDLTRVPYRS